MSGRRTSFEPRAAIGRPDTRISGVVAGPATTWRALAALLLGGTFSLGCGDTQEPADTVSPDDVAAEDASDGSADGGTCVGTPEPCDSFLNYTTCQQQRGCGWVFAYNDCRPNFPTGPYACELATNMEMCMGQVGCSWN